MCDKGGQTDPDMPGMRRYTVELEDGASWQSFRSWLNKGPMPFAYPDPSVPHGVRLFLRESDVPAIQACDLVRSVIPST